MGPMCSGQAHSLKRNRCPFRGGGGLLDSFFRGVLKAKGSSTNLLICSDHGNIEDLSIKTHTTNQVPLIVIGPDAPHFRSVERIDQVAPHLLSLFGL